MSRTDYDIRSEALERAVQVMSGRTYGGTTGVVAVAIAKSFETYLKGDEVES